ncbi:bifunctional UDP-N-acetylmuramate--L-alanine ligase/D-alanine--D-alanine ligase [Chlamydia sp. 17-3921]|uniref:bifunctional UDP-N-acetylmuramate--L-alanine ligase/D-alanine--D-alanine ligase n=1 Tax=Chlamydia sp. 17-3921 TaxID=2675798 RepID=UPI00191900E9|nr:bifunctional UDP-N-acetylmuramate--L-alanine ligase/D-alanine--D-alanine ligase [Chlamydia sp. 17-3921]
MNTTPHYHFIGIGGIGMSALAHILLDRGFSVSGSDLSQNITIEKLKSKGAKCFLGHHESYVPENSTVIYSSGISQDNIELCRAKEKGLPLLHRSQCLAMLMEGYVKILISGSHGKTTTSSLITAIFQEANLDPSYAIGGLNSDSLNGYSGSSSIFIAEADESDGSLKHYCPDIIVLTNLDNEHLVNYDEDSEKLLRTIQDFSEKVLDFQKVFYCGDSPTLFGKISGISYGFSSECQLRVLCSSQKEWQSVFSLVFHDIEYKDIVLNLPGQHNVANAAAACGVALTFGIDIAIIRKALEKFSGVQRRLERKNFSDRFLFLEDYAHHPVEITSTLRAVRDAVGLRRVIAICQPHRFSRLQACLNLFPEAFKDADEVILTDVYSAGEAPLDISMSLLSYKISLESLVKCSYIPFDQLVNCLKQKIRVHDVCISLGAGNIYTLGHSLKFFEPKKLALGVICGGKSCEYQISLLSASYVTQRLPSEYYECTFFVIDRDGLWNIVDDLEKSFLEGLGSHVFSSEIAQAIAKIDCFFPILHGPFGEDGSIQGFFKTIGKPYVGSDLLPAAISMDKIMTKRLASAIGIPVVPYQEISLFSWKRNADGCVLSILKAFTFPMIVKSSHLGSSLGIFLVHNEEELRKKISEAFLYDTDVFVEESRLGSREIEVSCIGQSYSYYIAKPNERSGTQGFIGYHEKYGLNGMTSAKISFDLKLSSESETRVKELAERVFKAIQGKGSARIDFFLDEEGNFWLSEINPIPGMTASSSFLKAFVQSNWSIEDVLDYLIIEGLHRFERQERVSRVIETSPELITNS